MFECFEQFFDSLFVNFKTLKWSSSIHTKILIDSSILTIIFDDKLSLSFSLELFVCEKSDFPTKNRPTNNVKTLVFWVS